MSQSVILGISRIKSGLTAKKIKERSDVLIKTAINLQTSNWTHQGEPAVLINMDAIRSEAQKKRRARVLDISCIKNQK